jgi:hypothetical protein
MDVTDQQVAENASQKMLHLIDMVERLSGKTNITTGEAMTILEELAENGDKEAKSLLDAALNDPFLEV